MLPQTSHDHSDTHPTYWYCWRSWVKYLKNLPEGWKIFILKQVKFCLICWIFTETVSIYSDQVLKLVEIKYLSKYDSDKKNWENRLAFKFKNNLGIYFVLFWSEYYLMRYCRYGFNIVKLRIVKTTFCFNICGSLDFYTRHYKSAILLTNSAILQSWEKKSWVIVQIEIFREFQMWILSFECG